MKLFSYQHRRPMVNEYSRCTSISLPPSALSKYLRCALLHCVPTVCEAQGVEVVSCLYSASDLVVAINANYR